MNLNEVAFSGNTAIHQRAQALVQRNQRDALKAQLSSGGHHLPFRENNGGSMGRQRGRVLESSLSPLGQVLLVAVANLFLRKG